MKLAKIKRQCPEVKEITEDIASQVALEKAEGINKAIEKLPTIKALSPLARKKVVEALVLTARGAVWHAVSRKLDLDWIDIRRHINNSQFKLVWDKCEEVGQELQRRLRADIAHLHATEGTEKRIYWQGQLVDTVKEHDHKLLQFLMEADDPKKYRASSGNVNINNVNGQQQVIWDFSGQAEQPKPPIEIRADDPPSPKQGD